MFNIKIRKKNKVITPGSKRESSFKKNQYQKNTKSTKIFYQLNKIRLKNNSEIIQAIIKSNHVIDIMKKFYVCIIKQQKTRSIYKTSGQEIWVYIPTLPLLPLYTKTNTPKYPEIPSSACIL